LTLVVLIGGARAGKSVLAVERASRWQGPVAYVATAEALDDEMRARIARHRAERPQTWTTVEEPLELRQKLESLHAETYAVVDCLTLWVSNLLERSQTEQAIVAEASAVAEVCATRAAPVVVVSNEVGLGIVPATPAGRSFRDVLGSVNKAFVARANDAFLVVAGGTLRLEQLP
jgi:adenosylcobinamide kinase/adenosylcobinamide-phosphate guanylyltransferase